METSVQTPKVKTGTPGMLIAARIARYLVGIIFIISGLIKLNDPVGTQIKLEEYFEVFAQDLPVLHGFFEGLIPAALLISVIMCVLEVVLGVALLVSYKPKLTTWVLLALVSYFTILTFYSAYFNKVTDCGCFGDALKLKPWTSFTKDVVLMVLILYIIGHRNRMPSRKTGWLVGLATILSIALGVYAIEFLPPLDLLPYAIGKNIPTQMKASEELRYKYIVTKDGQEFEFDKYPTEGGYTFKEMVLLNENAKPKITDYRVWNDTDGDFTQETFKGNKLFVIIKNVKDFDAGSMPSIRSLLKGLKGSAVNAYILTSVSNDEITAFMKEYQLEAPVYSADATVLKTIMRSNPGTWLLSDGVVQGKWHVNTTPTAEEILGAVGSGSK